MTDRPNDHPQNIDLPTEPTAPTITDRAPAAADPRPSSDDPKPPRWDGVRPHGRLGQITTALVATASAIFIAGALFVTGFMVGSEGGDEHHGYGGDGYSHSEDDHDRGGEAADGSGEATADLDK